MLGDLLRVDEDESKGMADRCTCCRRRIPRYAWYMLSGAICDVFQFIFDRLISSILVLPFETDTVSWTIAYISTIAMRHETHRYFVFGAYEGSYWTNLGKMYATYATTIGFSIILRSALAKIAESLPSFMLSYVDARTWGYLGTVIFTGVFSYFALKRNWGTKKAKVNPAPSDHYV